MRCALCKRGETAPGRATVTLERGSATVIIKDVPADVCDNCGEYYLGEDTTRTLMARAGDAAARGAEVAILRFAA